MINWTVLAGTNPVQETAFSASAAELLLFAVGVLFTAAVLTVFIIVLRHEVKRDARREASRAGDDTMR